MQQLKTQQLKIGLPIIQNSKFKTQNCQRQQLKIQNSKLKIAHRAIIQNSKFKTQNSK